MAGRRLGNRGRGGESRRSRSGLLSCGFCARAFGLMGRTYPIGSSLRRQPFRNSDSSLFAAFCIAIEAGVMLGAFFYALTGRLRSG